MSTSEVTYSTTSPTAQGGIYVGGGWSDSGDGISVFSGAPFPSQIGLVFSWDLGFDAAGRPIDPPRLVSQRLRLVTHNSVVADPGTEILELWAVPEAAPGNYSDVLVPFTRSELLVAAANAQWAGAPTTVEFTLGTYLDAAHANTATCTTNVKTLRTLYWSTSRWSGRIALSIQATLSAGTWTFDSAETPGGTPPALLSTECPFFTGVLGMPTNRRARVRRDAISGLPFMTDEAVESGYRKGLWVRPQSWDPPDPFEDRKFYPPPNESVPDDEVQ